MQSTSSLYSLSSCSPILLVRHYIQDCHVQKVTVHAGVLLSDTTALSSPRSPDVVLGERVLRILISCPECHIIPLTHSVFMFGTIEETPSIIRTGCKTGICDRKMIQFMPANHSNTNRVIAILIHSDTARFQKVVVILLRRVAKDVTSSLLSGHKRYDFNAVNFLHHSQ